MGVFKTIRLIKAIIVLGILFIGGVLVVGFIGCALIMGNAKDKGSLRKPKAPGQAAFEAANFEINKLDSPAGKTAFGNSPEAEKLATEYNTSLALLEKMMFKSDSRKKTSSSAAGFVTYCHLTGEKICFLVRVPQLRAYKPGKVRDALLKLAWLTGKSLTKKLCADKPRKLAVGLRGTVAYGAIATGRTDGDPVNRTGFVLVNDPLYPFFARPEKKLAPAGAKAESPPR